MLLYYVFYTLSFQSVKKKNFNGEKLIETVSTLMVVYVIQNKPCTAVLYAEAGDNQYHLYVQTWKKEICVLTPFNTSKPSLASEKESFSSL